jgi:hypothetical protein
LSKTFLAQLTRHHNNMSQLDKLTTIKGVNFS